MYTRITCLLAEPFVRDFRGSQRVRCIRIYYTCTRGRDRKGVYIHTYTQKPITNEKFMGMRELCSCYGLSRG